MGVGVRVPLRRACLDDICILTLTDNLLFLKVALPFRGRHPEVEQEEGIQKRSRKASGSGARGKHPDVEQRRRHPEAEQRCLKGSQMY